MAAAAKQYGIGSGGSQMVCGYTEAQQALEEELATTLTLATTPSESAIQSIVIGSIE